MKQIVMLAIGCLLVLSISGCSQKSELIECKPIVTYVKPTMPSIDKAQVEQCRYANNLSNTKCVLSNYMKMKEERDKLRSALEQITE